MEIAESGPIIGHWFGGALRKINWNEGDKWHLLVACYNPSVLPAFNWLSLHLIHCCLLRTKWHLLKFDLSSFMNQISDMASSVSSCPYQRGYRHTCRKWGVMIFMTVNWYFSPGARQMCRSFHYEGKLPAWVGKLEGLLPVPDSLVFLVLTILWDTYLTWTWLLMRLRASRLHGDVQVIAFIFGYLSQVHNARAVHVRIM